MWARAVEAMLGAWLLMSPFIFRHAPGQAAWWANDLACGALTAGLALASHWRPLRYSHLGLLAVGAWLIGFGYFAGPHPNPPALQNSILVGLLLLMFAVVPNEASLPPEAWERFEREAGKS